MATSQVLAPGGVRLARPLICAAPARRSPSGRQSGAGHFNQLEVPEQVNAMIERFMAVNGLSGHATPPAKAV